jgi:hypothetical protein
MKKRAARPPAPLVRVRTPGPPGLAGPLRAGAVRETPSGVVSEGTRGGSTQVVVKRPGGLVPMRVGRDVKVMVVDALGVSCPRCGAPPRKACDVSPTHAERSQEAIRQSLEDSR